MRDRVRSDSKATAQIISSSSGKRNHHSPARPNLSGNAGDVAIAT